MIEWFYKNIDAICISLGIAIAYLPIFHDIKQEHRMYNDEAKNGIIRLWRKIPRPTISGWLFLICIGTLFFFSYKKSEKDDREKSAFQKQVVDGQKEIKNATDSQVATSLRYTKKLEDFGNGLIRRDTLWYKQLDKWGLKIKDSMIVKKDGQALIKPINPLILLDTVRGVSRIHFILKNMGNIPANKADLDVRFIDPNNLTIANKLYTFHHTYAVGEEWESIGIAPEFNIKKSYFVYKISYVENGSLIAYYYTLGYSKEDETWLEYDMRFGHLFNK